jgi:retron-type reverse transcriptase
MNVSTKQQRIAELAKQRPDRSFTSLNHYLDVDWLREAYRRLRKDSAPGHDGRTVADYGKDLEANLQSLLERAKSGTYVAPPVRRLHIPKGAGKETLSSPPRKYANRLKRKPGRPVRQPPCDCSSPLIRFV